MKKKIIITSICIILILLIVAVAYFIFQKQLFKDREYQIEKITDYNYFVSRNSQSQQFGVIDTKGNILIPEEYNKVEIPNPSKPIFICQKDGKNIALSDSNEQIFTEYENIEILYLKNVASDLMYEKSVIKYEKDGKYGLLNLEGEKVTDPIYQEIDTLQYKEGELLVKKDDKYGVINYKGTVLVDIQYDQIKADTFFEENDRYHYDGYIVSQRTDNGYRYGYVSYTGEIYLDMIYNDMQRIPNIGNKDEVYLLVAENGKYGVFKNKEQLIENNYQDISYDNNNSIFIVQQGKLYGVINKEGKQVIDCKYEQLDVKGKYLYAQNTDKTDVYDCNGKLTNISPNTTIVAIPDQEEYTIRIQTDENQYQICKNEQPVTDQTFQYIAFLEKDLFIASKAGEKLGIIDIQGNEKTEFKYTSIQVIQNTELIQMSVDDIVEIANRQGISIAQMQNAIIEQEEKYIRIFNDTDVKYITLDGKIVENKEILVDNTLFAMMKDGKWGYVDKSGNFVVEAIYDKVTEFNKYGFAGVLKDGKWGMIKQDGTIGLEPSESNISSQAEPEFIGVYHQVQYSSGQIYYVK